MTIIPLYKAVFRAYNNDNAVEQVTVFLGESNDHDEAKREASAVSGVAVEHLELVRIDVEYIR